MTAFATRRSASFIEDGTEDGFSAKACADAGPANNIPKHA
jgi:hypothetical protein